jgi:hypothetical protein
VTLLLPRAKSTHYLTLLLSTLLALPSNLPTLEHGDSQADRGPLSSTDSGLTPGSRMHKPDRRSSHHQSEWSVVADEPEAPYGREDFRFTSLTIANRPLDLPSLIPASFDPRPIDPIAPDASTSHTPPLRC